MIGCARRELALRKRVYPKLIFQQKMSGDEADSEIELMSRICSTLEQLKREREGFMFKEGI
jgi:hypothetical protein